MYGRLIAWVLTAVSDLHREDHRSRPQRPHAHLYLRLGARQAVGADQQLVRVVVVVLSLRQSIPERGKLRVFRPEICDKIR